LKYVLDRCVEQRWPSERRCSPGTPFRWEAPSCVIHLTFEGDRPVTGRARAFEAEPLDWLNGGGDSGDWTRGSPALPLAFLTCRGEGPDGSRRNSNSVHSYERHPTNSSLLPQPDWRRRVANGATTTVPLQTRQPPPAPFGAILISGAVIAAAIISANNHSQKVTSPQPVTTVAPSAVASPWPKAEVIVRRASRDAVQVPRAQAVGSAVHLDKAWFSDPANVGRWVALQVPNQGSVWVHYRGQIGNLSELPNQPKLWDWYHAADGNSWIWMAPVGLSRVGWVDP
jgi:hypothetical protein